ncbi:MAG TPA: carboxypeptidase-like regulatory domain-containing protein, partial [Polyangia bacterium]
MEFASRRTLLLAVLAGLALLLTTGACRRSGRRVDAARPATPVASTFSLAGRVTDEVDRAVPGARVLAFGPLQDAAPPARRESRSDQSGRFTFEGLPRGRYTLLVEAVGLASIEPPAVDVPGAAPVIRLSGQGRSLSGGVFAAGHPEGGARVRLGADAWTLSRETVSDDAGRFVFHGLGAGSYALRATKGLLASPVVGDVATDDAAVVTPPARPREALRLELGRGFGVEGTVVDEGGRGLPGAEVRAEAAPDDPLAEAATTAADGRFRLGPLPPGRLRLVARAPGHLVRAPAYVTLAPGAASPAQRLELVSAASIEGRVADARGAPVAGAQIRCGGGGADLTDLAVIFDALPLAAEAAALGGSLGRELGATKVARSDAGGAFHLDDLLPGPVRLAVTRAPFAPLVTEAPALAPGEHRELGVLTLRDADAPSATGAPVPGPARRADATLVGVARDSGGRPLPRARVRAWPLGDDVGLVAAAPTSPSLGSAVTDAGGHFTLGNLPNAPLLLELDHPRYPVTLARATPGAPTELTVPIPGGIDGEVRERITGASVPRATIEGLGPDGLRVAASGAGRAKGSGAFRLLRLRPGPWTLTVKAPGYRTSVRDVDVPESPILGETSVRGLRLELDAD